LTILFNSIQSLGEPKRGNVMERMETAHKLKRVYIFATKETRKSNKGKTR